MSARVVVFVIGILRLVRYKLKLVGRVAIVSGKEIIYKDVYILIREKIPKMVDYRYPEHIRQSAQVKYYQLLEKTQNPGEGLEEEDWSVLELLHNDILQWEGTVASTLKNWKYQRETRAQSPWMW